MSNVEGILKTAEVIQKKRELMSDLERISAQFEGGESEHPYRIEVHLGHQNSVTLEFKKKLLYDLQLTTRELVESEIRKLEEGIAQAANSLLGKIS